MTSVSFFWILTVVGTICASAFVVPQIWLSGKTQDFSLQVKQILTVCLVTSLPLLAYSIYGWLGSSNSLKQYYSAAACDQRVGNQQMRPYHARLQRELVKSRLTLAIDPKNIDLIINFAGVHSKLSSGILQPEIKTLLDSVINFVPGQITALNLLAVHAYKTESYAQAIDYWQRILNQITPTMRGSEAENILKSKIAQTQRKIKPFESRQTK